MPPVRLIPFAALALPITAAQARPAPAPAPIPASVASATADWQDALVARAKALGVTDVTTRPAPNGGFILDGKIAGDAFALGIPSGWQGGALLYAHGYSTPGTPVAVSDDPVAKGPGTGLLGEAYSQGFAVGHSAYAKAGLGVETGVTNTKRLRDLVEKLGGKRIYVMGDSMGGGIVVTLLEMYPRAFAGGLARCGVVDSWQDLLGRLIDMRLAYNVLTKDTPYALPGEQDVRKNAIAPEPPAGTPDAAAQAYVWGQIGKVGAPPLALWAAAQKNPDGQEAKIVRAVTAIGGFDNDAAALAFPLVTATLGAEDMAATAGGWVYGNVGKIYAAPGLTPEENAALNRDIQRVEAAPAALAYLQRWHTATGRIATPLVTIHNRIDSLVPFAQEDTLKAAVAKAGRGRYLVQYGVPPTRAPLPIGGIEGYTHCGFDKGQTLAAWTALRGWVETGAKPSPELP
ncbi:alpha/beta hydrolase family protein [Novosphingobium soli]|uniref:Alpha/beta hydrolase family protein n=1 Tax=Novosphingobium soli TaxID=574956 RepID=A0ABV6CY90_9SPHN